RLEAQAPVFTVHHVLEEIHRLWQFVPLKANGREDLQEVVGTTPMMRNPKVVQVSPRIAGSDDQVMFADRVFDQLQQWGSPVRIQPLANSRPETAERNDRMVRAQEFREVIRVERNHVNDLSARRLPYANKGTGL